MRLAHISITRSYRLIYALIFSIAMDVRKIAVAAVFAVLHKIFYKQQMNERVNSRAIASHSGGKHTAH